MGWNGQIPLVIAWLTGGEGRLNGAAKASDIIGMTVKNYQHETLAKVDDLAVDVESGRIIQLILAEGGFIGAGESLTAVPPSALHHDVEQKVLHLDADKAKLKGAPRFQMSKWSECCDSNQVAQVYQHYGQESALRFIGDDKEARDAERLAGREPATQDRQNTVSTYKRADGTLDEAAIARASRPMIPVARLNQIQRASKLMGKPVNNLQGEKLGKVENMLLDLPSGRIVAIVVSSGGFLGMGDELSAVPPTALRFSTDRDTLQLDASKEMLTKAPHFKANQWPDFAQPIYADGIYRSYRVDSYFTTNVTAEANNTARNVRDRADGTLTPLDQGNSKSDVDITSRIRKGILAEKDMSINAKNVKIITNQGQVTLRGPVNTAEEKRAIGDIANSVAIAANVDNQLEVK
jgi:hyperosmotically inducible periplasmic protein